MATTAPPTISHGHRGTDAIPLALRVPLLAVATAVARRGSMRGHPPLSGALAYFLYVCARLSLGATHNDFFPCPSRAGLRR